MGAAWRNVKEGKDFDQVLEMVRTVRDLDMEVCITLGMLTEDQARRLSEAGLYAYNHNLDTSEEHYKKVISTRGYEDRIETIGNARKAGLTVCSGYNWNGRNPRRQGCHVGNFILFKSLSRVCTY